MPSQLRPEKVGKLVCKLLLLTGKQPARTYVFAAGALILTLIALGGLVELSR